MLRLRVLSALALLPVTVAAAWLGGLYFLGLVIAAALLGGWEFYRKISPSARPLGLAGMVFILLFLLWRYFSPGFNLPVLLLVALVASILAALLRTDRLASLRAWGWVWAGAIYLGWGLGMWLGVRGMAAGREWVLLGFAATFACDTSAFFIGGSLGQLRLAPTVSPRKTWEGAVAGLAGAIVATVIVAELFRLPIGLLPTLALGGAMGVSAQVGDLLESWLKRRAGTKDSGRLIPGHGGMLDRLDSVVFVGLVLYYFLQWLLR